MPVCVFKGIASHSRVGACAHITADGLSCPESHTRQGASGHASLGVAQKLVELRREEKILSAGWEPLKELSTSVILSDCFREITMVM